MSEDRNESVINRRLEVVSPTNVTYTDAEEEIWQEHLELQRVREKKHKIWLFEVALVAVIMVVTLILLLIWWYNRYCV